jgi:transcriptional repressor NrdR
VLKRRDGAMHCPFCRHPDSRVVDSRTTDDGTSIRRRRQCPDCSRRFTTVETCSLMVVKRSGVTEPFSRNKVINGVRKACQGRPVTEDALAQLGQRVEEAVRATGSAEVAAHDVGLAILGPLQELDLVAYLRFASVYRAFDSLEDFEAAITELRQQQRGRTAVDDDDHESTVAERQGTDRGSGGAADVPVPATAAD